jgi:hypothetical protein
MPVALNPAPEQGQLVSVRSRNWIVNEVVLSTLPTGGLQAVSDPQTLISLASVVDDGLGEEVQVIWELEPGARLIEKVALPEPTGFDPPDQLNAFLDAVPWGASSSADVRNIQSPFRPGIDIEDYQLDTVVRAIQMPRVNLLVADDVGLGKTIEAGMVALELIIRHRARKILIVCLASLQVQWQEQMRDKRRLDLPTFTLGCPSGVDVLGSQLFAMKGELAMAGGKRDFGMREHLKTRVSPASL